MSSTHTITIESLISYLLKKTQHALRLKMDCALKSLMLTTPQYAVLAQLELNPYISNADLARRAFITPQTMHSILLNLEEQGLLQRNAHPQNKRILLATLTDQGHVTVQEAHKKIKAVETKMLASLSSEDKKHFEQLLRNCFNAMNND